MTLKYRTIIYIICVVSSATFILHTRSTPVAKAENISLAQRLQGHFLLQVEDKGQLWYINPADLKRRLITINNAITTLSQLALGINNENLDKLPTAIYAVSSDIDSDNDGYNDQLEAKAGYKLFGVGRALFDDRLIERLKGKLLLQVENNGRMWYVNPIDEKKYEIKQDNVFLLMQTLALGISNDDLKLIDEWSDTNYTPKTTNYSSNDTYTNPTSNAINLSQLSQSVRYGQNDEIIKYFTPNLRDSMIYTLNSWDASNRELFADILQEVRLTADTNDKKIYAADIPFNNALAQIQITTDRQDDGSWLISAL